MTPKRKPSQDALRASRPRSEEVGILEAYREFIDALGLTPPDYEAMRAEPQAFERISPQEAETLGDTAPQGSMTFRIRDAWEPASEHMEEKLATIHFLTAWSLYDPSLSALPEATAKQAVELATGFVLDWKKKAESLSALGDISQAAIQLAYMDAAVAMELTLARSPIFSGGKAAGHTQLSLLPVGYLYGKPFKVLEPNGPLTAQDLALLAHLIKQYAEQGFPPDRRVRMSLSEAARASGYKGEGGKQRELVRTAFARMRSTTYQNLARLPDGTVKSLTWGLIDWAATYEPAGEGGRALVTLSEPLVTLIKLGSLVYLEDAILEELVSRDEYGARLWVFLESESLTSPREYYLFSAPEGEPEQERDTPAIADLLRMDWTERRSIAFRVKRAARVISEVDPRYTLSVEKAVKRAGKGMWKLRARKRRGAVDNLPAGGEGRGYPQERYPVPSVTLPGTPSNADTPQTRIDTGKTHTMPSVLPSDLPSIGFDFLHKQLGTFGVTAEELQDPKSDWSKALSRASRRFKEWVPIYFGGVEPERREELVKDLLREMVVGLIERNPKDPLRYLSTSVKQAKTPGSLFVEDYALASLKRRYSESE